MNVTLIPVDASSIAIHEVAGYDELGTATLGARIGTLTNLSDIGDDEVPKPSNEWRIEASDGTDIAEVSELSEFADGFNALKQHVLTHRETAAAAA